MLVDRSLGSMAALMTVFAVIMVMICVVYFRSFLQRGNRHSTSIGAKIGERCDIINISYLPVRLEALGVPSLIHIRRHLIEIYSTKDPRSSNRYVFDTLSVWECGADFHRIESFL